MIIDVVEVKKEQKLYDDCMSFLAEKYDKKNRGIGFWKKRFENKTKNRIGYALYLESNLVGFIGLIESEDMLALSSWFVLDEYRKYSMDFLRNVMSNIENEKIVNSSPNPIAFKIFHKLYKFNFNIEYVGLPKKIFGYSKSYFNNFYFGKRINICYDNKVSLLALIFFTFRYKKLCLSLKQNKGKFFFQKKINVLHKNINYFFPLSIYGDIFE